MSATDLPLLLMAIIAPLGAFDILYYHLWKFRLYDAPSARWETVTHLVRGSVFAVLAALLTTKQPAGVWYWVIVVPLALDFVNEIVDVSLEGSSRAPLGGLPRLEYVVHIVGATFVGAIAAAFLVVAWPAHTLPTTLVPAMHPAWLSLQGYALAIGGALMTSAELCLFLRSIKRSGWRPA